MSPKNEIAHTMSAVSVRKVFDYIPFLMDPHKGSALADEVYEHVLRRIVFPEEDSTTQIHYAGKITESMIAKELQVSNGPVREAFYRLRQEGWIYTDRNRGSFLVDFSDPAIVKDIYRFRVNFETGSFFNLAIRINDDQLTSLERIINALEKAVRTSDISAFRQADINFHLMANEMAGGRQYASVYRPKLMQWYAMAYHVLIKSMGTSLYKTLLEAPGLPTHRDLFEAIARRESLDAANLISKHFSFIFDLFESTNEDSGVA